MLKNVYSVIGDTMNPIYFTNCYNYTMHLANAIGNPDACCKEFPIQGNEGLAHPVATKAFLEIFSPGTKVSVLQHGLVTILAMFNKEMKFLKHMSQYFKESSEEFLANEYQTYKVFGEPKLSLTEYAHKLKEERIFDQSSKFQMATNIF